MDSNNYRIALSFPIAELSDRVLSLLAAHEISCTSSSDDKCHYIGDERQEEFVEANVRLCAWHVCSALSGWNATTEFDSENHVAISLTPGIPSDARRNTLLGENVRDWICADVALRALRVMTADKTLVEAAEEMADVARQRTLMMLCASDMLRKVG